MVGAEGGGGSEGKLIADLSGGGSSGERGAGCAARCSGRRRVRRQPAAEQGGAGQPWHGARGCGASGRLGRASSEPAARLKLQAASGGQPAQGDAGAAGVPRVNLRAGGETRRWPAAEQAAGGGRSGGEQSRRRFAALLRTRTRYREPRTAPSFPASLAFSAPFARRARGKLEPWGRSRRTTCSRHGHRPWRAPGASFHPRPLARGQAPCLQPAAGRAATLITGNSNSRWVGLGRTGTALPTRFLDIWSLCSPRLREGLLGSGLGRISAVNRALGYQSCPLLRPGSPFGQWNGVGRTATAGWALALEEAIVT